WILEIGVVCRVYRAREIPLHVEERVDDALAIAGHTDVEIPVAQRVEPRPGRHDALGDFEPDLAPLVDDPGPIVLIGLIDIPVQRFEAEPLGPGLLQQALRLCPRFFNAWPVPGNLLQLLLVGRQRRPWEDNTADGVNIGDLGELRGALPTVDR